MIELFASLAAAGAMFCFVIGLFWDFEPDQVFPTTDIWGTGHWFGGPK